VERALLTHPRALWLEEARCALLALLLSGIGEHARLAQKRGVAADRCIKARWHWNAFACST